MKNNMSYLQCSLLILSLSFQIKAITYVFCHGLGSSGSEALRYVKGHSLELMVEQNNNIICKKSVSLQGANPFFILYEPVCFFHFPYAHQRDIYQSTDGVIHFKKGIPSPEKTSLGQELEIAFLHTQLSQIQDDCVLFGRSLGAASLITYLGHLAEHNLSHTIQVKALIVEAPFDTIENVLWNRFSLLNWTGLVRLGRKILYQNYNSKGIKPLDSIEKIFPNIPILFVHSKKDTLIHWKSSLRLYKRLCQQGRKNVHFFILDAADHNNATEGSDGLNYRNVVHAFYKKYGLPHDSDFACQGQALFAMTSLAGDQFNQLS